MIPATCHPDKPARGRGLCKNCYLKVWKSENPEKVKASQRRSSEKNREQNRERARLFRVNNPEEAKARNRRNYHKFKDRRLAYLTEWKKVRKVQVLSHRYKAPEADVLRVLAIEQCEACGSTEGLHFDHDHQTGILRGRLCRLCNMAVGHLRDSSEIAFSIGRYLLKHESKEVQLYPEWIDRRTVAGRAVKG